MIYQRIRFARNPLCHPSILFGVFLASLLCWCLVLNIPSDRLLQKLHLVYQWRPRHNTLGIASQILVISLPGRVERRRKMESLRETLGLTWTYINATGAEDAVVNSLISHVQFTRINSTTTSFRWPESFEWLDASWTHPGVTPPLLSLNNKSDADTTPLTCAARDNDLTAYFPDLPQHLLLTRSRIACWHSHLTTIHQVAISDSSEPTIILEDDVDMERDIHVRLRHAWQFLPSQWDVVFLGHCWSNESYHEPLNKFPNRFVRLFNGHGPTTVTIHPSKAPKCTHAYALSAEGARRLLLHLTYPPFAYSRAIDQAFAWLVISGRLKSFSIVPSVVVQRKMDNSDIMSGSTGSTWKDALYDGVFG